MKKKILICGATGFIGRNLVEYYSTLPGFEVTAVYHKVPPYEIPNVVWRQADLRNPEEVDVLMVSQDIVLQFAATTSGAKDIVSTPEVHVTDNAVMNSYIFRSAKDHNVGHVVFPSCTVMYQPAGDVREEDFNNKILERYFGVGHTKVYLEKMCEFFASISDTKFTVIRHSNIYGPHDKYDLDKSHVFGATITKVMTAVDKVVVWGTGEEKRDFLHIEDLVNFVDAAIENQVAKFELFNVGCGEGVSIKELVELVIANSGKNLTIEYDLSQPHIPTSIWLNCDKACDKLDWYPQYPLSDGIIDTIQWWRENVAD